MDVNYLLYGKKYPFLLERTSERCGCQDTTDHIHSQNYFNSKIGVINHGMASIIADMVGIRLNWEEAIKYNSKIEVRFNTLELRSERGIYYLLATDNKNNHKSIVELVEDNGGLYEARKGGGITVTCSGCPEGCNPVLSNGDWSCSACGGGGGSCVKTITYSLRAILSGDK
jgi:hypothetical protein